MPFLLTWITRTYKKWAKNVSCALDGMVLIDCNCSSLEAQTEATLVH